jgi:hypothetical protein
MVLPGINGRLYVIRPVSQVGKYMRFVSGGLIQVDTRAWEGHKIMGRREWAREKAHGETRRVIRFVV